jgi:ribosomal protein S18 acetylase RimI-like enzyme
VSSEQEVIAMVESGRVAEIERIIEDDLERHYGFPAGVLGQGGITHWRADSQMALWTAKGGVAVSADAELAGTLARIIAEHKGDDYAALLSRLEHAVSERVPSASCWLYAFPYCCAPRAPVPVSAAIEVVHPDEFFTDGDYPEGYEHVFIVRDGSEVVAHAVNRRSLDAGGYQFHAIGVGVREAYRRRGLGRAVVSALVAHIASEGGVALWSADVTNIASCRLARSVGFVDHVFKLSWEVANAG